MKKSAKQSSKKIKKEKHSSSLKTNHSKHSKSKQASKNSKMIIDDEYSGTDGGYESDFVVEDDYSDEELSEYSDEINSCKKIKKRKQSGTDESYESDFVVDDDILDEESSEYHDEEVANNFHASSRNKKDLNKKRAREKDQNVSCLESKGKEGKSSKKKKRKTDDYDSMSESQAIESSIIDSEESNLTQQQKSKNVNKKIHNKSSEKCKEKSSKKKKNKSGKIQIMNDSKSDSESQAVESSMIESEELVTNNPKEKEKKIKDDLPLSSNRNDEKSLAIKLDDKDKTISIKGNDSCSNSKAIGSQIIDSAIVNNVENDSSKKAVNDSSKIESKKKDEESPKNNPIKADKKPKNKKTNLTPKEKEQLKEYSKTSTLEFLLLSKKLSEKEENLKTIESLKSQMESEDQENSTVFDSYDSIEEFVDSLVKELPSHIHKIDDMFLLNDLNVSTENTLIKLILKEKQASAKPELKEVNYSIHMDSIEDIVNNSKIYWSNFQLKESDKIIQENLKEYFSNMLQDIKNLSNCWYQGLSSLESENFYSMKMLRIIQDYSKSSQMNQYLVKKDPLILNKMARYLHMHIYNNTYLLSGNRYISQNCLYRFTNIPLDMIEFYTENSIVFFTGFTSTSKIPLTGFGHVQFIIHLRSMNSFIQSGIDISNISIFKGEQEVLILPYILFKIIKVEKNPANMCQITLEEIEKQVLIENILKPKVIKAKPENSDKTKLVTLIKKKNNELSKDTKKIKEKIGKLEEKFHSTLVKKISKAGASYNEVLEILTGIDCVKNSKIFNKTKIKEEVESENKEKNNVDENIQLFTTKNLTKIEGEIPETQLSTINKQISSDEKKLYEKLKINVKVLSSEDIDPDVFFDKAQKGCKYFYDTSKINKQDLNQVNEAIKIVNVRIFQNKFKNTSKVTSGKVSGEVELLLPRGGVELVNFYNEDSFAAENTFQYKKKDLITEVYYRSSDMNPFKKTSSKASLTFIPKDTSLSKPQEIEYSSEFLELYNDRRTFLKKRNKIQSADVFNSEVKSHNLYLIIDNSGSMTKANAKLEIELKKFISPIRVYILVVTWGQRIYPIPC